jgi:hypothetical protein
LRFHDFLVNFSQRGGEESAAVPELIYNSAFANIISVNGGFKEWNKAVGWGSGCGEFRWEGMLMAWKDRIRRERWEKRRRLISQSGVVS